MKWISILERLPESQERVYVCVMASGCTKPYQTIAEYIPPKTVLYNDYINEEYDYEDKDYDPEIDDYWTPEGWYEWQSMPDINWEINGEITHWMPLFELPV